MSTCKSVDRVVRDTYCSYVVASSAVGPPGPDQPCSVEGNSLFSMLLTKSPGCVFFILNSWDE